VNVMLWGVLPYVVMAIVVVGTAWRWRYDQFGWTTRSSQLYESRLLRLGSPLFHFGILVVLLGHVIGLVVPKSWTDAAHLSQEAYHVQALALGGVAGVCTLVGIAILVAGLAATALNAFGHGDAHNYRLNVSLWFRSLFVLHPDVDAMAGADVTYQIHAVLAMVLFAAWPFTRLVHAFSAPIVYLFRPYVVYRRRTPAGSAPSSRAPRRGWERVGRP
jgi:nitrate reductase gamma subunit